MALRARVVLSKIRGLRKVEFDTTGKGYFLTAKNFEPDAQMIEEALADARLSALQVKSVKEVELPKTVARYEVSAKGLA